MVQGVRTQEGVMGGDVLIDELELLLDRVQPARRRRRGSGVGGRRGARESGGGAIPERTTRPSHREEGRFVHSAGSSYTSS
jgi:hypothetical protein